MLALISSSAYTQTTDRFIRIVGSSSHEFNSDGIKVEFAISEVAANERKEIAHVPYEDVYAGFIDALQSLGIEEGQLTRKDFNVNKYGQTMVKNMTLSLNDIAKVQRIGEVVNEGVRISSMVYTYSNVAPAIESQLIIDAINDAKRKAANICKEIDMHLGKILNIEDTSTGCCGEIKDSQQPTTTKTYNVNVTFELKDR
jgi:uncharacterized protein YggE